jgi:GntR family transcriptional regulator
MTLEHNALTPVSKNLLYVQVERQIEDLLVRGRYKAGDRIPPEAELVESLGVSRSTVRSGLARLVERGLLERRQGSGTFLVRPPEGGRLRKGLERLESYSVQAQRAGLELDSRDLRIEAASADGEEAAVLEVPEGSRLVRVLRVLLVAGQPTARMLDVVPEEVLALEKVRRRFRPDAMMLDLLVSEGIPVGFTELSIEGRLITPDDPIGKALNVSSPAAALSLSEKMYLANGRPVQWSRDVFLPGHLDLRVVRELFEVRNL